MDTAKLVLEYLTLALSWPVILGLLVAYFLKRHGQAVNNILTRVNSVSFPGGVTLGTTVYPSEPTNQGNKNDKGDITVRFSPNKVLEPVESLEIDFISFLWQGIAVNRATIGLEIDRLWTQLKHGPVPPTILTGSESKTHSDKLRVMMGNFKIDEQAIKDFDEIDGVNKKAPRSDLVRAYTKSENLKTYISKLSPSFWKT